MCRPRVDTRVCPYMSRLGHSFLDVFEALLEELDDVLVVEGVVNVLTIAAGAHEAHAA
jgi:hypothetical protein